MTRNKKLGMKKNNKIKITQILKTAFLLTFILAGFFGLTRNVYAKCTFGVNFGSDKSTVSYSDSFNLTAKVTASGSTADCGNSVLVSLEMACASAPSAGGNYCGQSNQTANLVNNVASQTFNIKPQDLDHANLLANSTLNYRVTIYDSNQSQVTQSGLVAVMVTNIPGLFYHLPVSVSFSSNAGTFNNGDKTDVIAAASNLSSLNSSIKNITVAVYVNDQSKPIDSLNVAAPSSDSYSFTYSNLVINSTNNFKNTSNTVTIKLYQSGTSNEIGEGSAILQAQGIGAAPAGPQVSIQSGTYATGTEVSVTSANLPAGGTVTFYVNGTKFDEVSVDDEMSGYTIKVDDQNFKLGSNAVTAEVYNEDDSLLKGNITVGTITVGSGSGATTPPGGGQTSNSTTTLYNPIPGSDNLTTLLVTIMKAFLGIIGIWAVAFIVIGGFRMVVSSGSEEAVLAAKKTITWAVLGLLAAVLSFAIIAIVQNIIGVKIQ